MRAAAQAAKKRIETGTGALRDEYEPAPEPAAASAPAAGIELDDRPTIEVDLPEEFSFTDFDPGAPSAPEESAAEVAQSAPAVRFDDAAGDITTDDDGIPIWEDPA